MYAITATDTEYIKNDDDNDEDGDDDDNANHIGNGKH